MTIPSSWSRFVSRYQWDTSLAPKEEKGRSSPDLYGLPFLPCVEQFLRELIQHLPYGLYLIVCEFICF